MNFRKRVIAGVGATLLFASTALTGLAETTDTATGQVTIVEGPFTVSATDFNIGELAFELDERSQVGSGAIEVVVTDMRGNHDGWQVIFDVADFENETGDTIPGTNLRASGYPPIVGSAGSQPFAGPGAGPSGGWAGSVIDDTTLTGSAGSSTGVYTINGTMRLDVPALQESGTYTSTLTLTLNDGNTP